jgi:hypothetical protein
MSTLTDFLKEQAARLRTEGPSRQAILEDWVRAVELLLNQIREWTKEADPENVLKIEKETCGISEEGLGYYHVSRLKIRLDAREVLVTPVARQVVGRFGLPGEPPRPSLGRVDITDGLQKYMLYRIEAAPRNQWYIVDERFRTREFDQAAYEEALVDLLK